MEKYQDNITFATEAEKTVVNDTVKIIVQVTSQIDSDASQETANDQIATALRDFIPADWALGQVSRHSQVRGSEIVSVSASARVHASENYNLAERCKEASRRGLELNNPSADNSLSAEVIKKTKSELRQILYKEIMEELKRANEALTDHGCGWTVGDITFDSVMSQRSKGASRLETFGANMMATASSAGVAKGGVALETSHKLNMTATVTFSRPSIER